MKSEDLEYISQEISNLNESITNSKFNNESEIDSEIKRIQQEALDRKVPIFLDKRTYLNKFRNKELGTPPEYYEEEESEEYSED